ncbi:MAG: hypothetical protein ABSF47_02800 [Minisyncoccia bacterium]|jgi:hypothetical protein
MNYFKKRLITEIAISLLIVGALFAGILFFNSNMDGYVRKITTNRQLFAARAAAIDQLASLRSDYNNKANNYLNVLYNIIPSYDQLINLNQELQSLAAQNKLGYSFSFAGETQKSTGGLGSVSFSINVNSDNFNSLMSFIKSLQNFRYLSSIDNVSMKSNESLLSMDISGRVFYR